MDSIVSPSAQLQNDNLLSPWSSKGAIGPRTAMITAQPCGRQRSCRGTPGRSCCPCPRLYACVRTRRHRQLPFGLLRSPNRSGSAQTFKRVKQKCLRFYFRATCLELAQCPRKRGRCSRLRRLSPTMKKNVGSKEPTFAKDIRLLTNGRLFCHLRSFRGTGQRSSDPWGLLRSPSRSPRSCQPASGLPRRSA